MTAPSHLSSTRPRVGRARRYLLAVASATLLLLASAAPAASIGLGSPATLDEVLASAGYDARHSDVLRLYQAFFEREPDVAGAVYWIGQFEAGATLDDLAYGFARSTEFISRYGDALSNRAFLEIVYGNVLGRTPDQAGLDYWTGQLDAGLSQHGVVRWVAANDEFAASYPFSPEFVDVTPDSFIALADLPDGWVGDVFVTEEPLDRSTCNDRMIAPGNAVLASYEAPDQSDFLEQYVVVYSSAAEAERFIDDTRGYPASCPDFVDVAGDRTVPGPLTFRAVGDSSASMRETVTTGGTTNTYERHMVTFRLGRVLVIVWSSAEVGEPATDLNAAVDLIVPRMLADLS